MQSKELRKRALLARVSGATRSAGALLSLTLAAALYLLKF